MKAVTISYERKVNLGNYESKGASIEIALDEGDDAKEGLVYAQSMVDTFLGKMKGTPVVQSASAPKTETKEEAPEKNQNTSDGSKPSGKTRNTKIKDEPKFTAADVQSALKDLANHDKSSMRAKELLKEVAGVEKVAEITDESLYAEIIKKVKKCLN